MPKRRTINKLSRVLFWGIIGLVLLTGVRQILAMPTAPTGRSRSPVVVNEFMAAPQDQLTDEDGEFSDWIELHNRSSRTVNLAGWSLSDGLGQPNKWMLPDMDLAPDEYLIVFASGKDRIVLQGEDDASSPILHTNFRLASEGGTLAAYDNTSRRFLDASAVEYPPQFDGMSYGRCGDDGAYCYLQSPTPGTPNDASQAWRGIVAPVKASIQRGFHDEPFQVELATATRDAVIRYTSDGSTPSETNGIVYDGPITIATTTPLRAAAFKPGFLESPVATYTYIFPDDVLAQPDDPPGFPTTWGTHRIDFASHSAGSPVLADYEMDPEIVKDPRYREQMRESLLSLPALSIVTDVDNLDIYFTDPQMRGVQSERPASVELISPDGSEEGFQVNTGLRIQGGAGRWEFMPKHSFRLFFKDDYGPTKLRYPLFPDSHMEEFDTVVLRAGVDRSFAGHPDTGDHRQTTYTRDEWLRRSQIATSGLGPHGRFVHLYLNGLYWGLYNLVERPDASFASSYLGKDKEDWYAANQGGSVSGMIDRFQVLLNLTAEGNLADPQRYATMMEFIDPIQFSDYMIVNWFAGNQDWPENNWYVDVQYPAGQNLFFNWDGELSWVHGAEVRLGVDDVGDTYFPNIIKPIFLALMENPDYRMTLADRLYRHTAGGGALSDPEAIARWVAINSEVEKAIVAEAARWGDVRYEEPITPEDWAVARDQVSKQMDGNAERLIALAREAGYYPPIDPPQFSVPGTTFVGEVNLAMEAPLGQIFYTTDGSDPRTMVTGQVSPHATAYQGPIKLSTTTRVKARALDGETWSALQEADFVEAQEPSGLRITEIMYNPLGGDAYEFIELANVGGIEIDLSGAYFEGINLYFDRNVRIPAGERWVLSPDFKAYRERYPEEPIHAIYQGKLSNQGETLTLYDAQGNLLVSVSYDDENGWPLTADGMGDSLVLQRLDGSPNSPRSWRASEAINGTPGTDEVGP